MKSTRFHFFILAAVCFFVFWWRLGALGLIDPDEPFYAQTAREMNASHDWLTPKIYGAPQFEKPIFYYWLVAASFRVFGENEFAGRVPSALFGTFAVLLTWVFARRVFNARAALLAALALATGLEFDIMSRLMLTDVPLAVFLAGSVFAFYLAWLDPEKRERWIFAALMSSALAALTKGPIGSIIPLLAAISFLLAGKNRARLGIGFWSGLAAYLLIVAPWYALMFLKFGRRFWDEFFIRDNWLRLIVAEHPANNHLWYYFGVLLLGSIPWMPLGLLSIWRFLRRDTQSDASRFIWCWLLSSFVFLTIAQSKLPSYCVFLFIPLALLAGVTADDLLARGFRAKGERYFVLALAGAQGIAPFAAIFLKITRPFAAPALTMGACLAAGFYFLLAQKHARWLASLALGSMAMMVTAVTIANDFVESMTSARPVARRVLEIKKNNEPVLAAKFLVRGIFYYVQREGGGDVFVFAEKSQPFWAAHPLPVIVWKNQTLLDLVVQRKSALCVLRKREWEQLKGLPFFQSRDALEEIGDNVLVRALAP